MNKKYILSVLTGIMTMSVVFAEDVPIEKSGEDNLLDVLQPGNMMITDYARLGVAADFLGTYSRTKDKSSNSEGVTDFVLDTLDISLDVDVTDNIKFSTVVEYQDGEDLFVDNAFFDVALENEGKLIFSVGKATLPFGKYEGGMITDPLTLELGEMTKTGFGLTYKLMEEICLSAWAFRGEIEEEFNDAIFVVDFSPAEGINLGVGFVTDICEGVLVDYIEAEGDEYESTSGVAIWAKFDISESLTIMGEYVAAIENIQALEEAKPDAWTIGLEYVLTDAFALSARIENACEFVPEELPESRVGATASYAFNDVASLSIEYLYSKYAGEAELDNENALSMMLSFEF